MKKLMMTCATSTLILASSMANADIKSWIEETEIAANVRLANDYQFYGSSQTSGAATGTGTSNDNGTSIQGGFDITLPVTLFGGQFYAGIFAANVEWGRGTVDPISLEFTPYGGIAGDSIFSSGISWDIGVANYMYPNSDADAGFSDDFDYFEVYGNLGYTFEEVMLSPSVGVGLYYSPNWFGYGERSFHIPVSLDLSLPYDFGFNFFFGHLDVDFDANSNALAFAQGIDGYQYYGVGISRSFLGVDWDISYTAISDDDDCAITQTGAADGSVCGGVVFGVSKAF